MEGRYRKLNQHEKKGRTAYWMDRDQRAEDNWALIFSQMLSDDVLVFCIASENPFMMAGLKETEQRLSRFKIPLYIISGNPEEAIPKFIEEHKISCLVTDFSPLRQKTVKNIADHIEIPFYEVDAHNIVPCWIASDKQEYGAYTLRPKINRLLPKYLHEFPRLKKQKGDVFENKLKIKSCSFKPGAKAANDTLKGFIRDKLARYNERNDPNKDVQSNLSPYLHFGQISAQRVALEVSKAKGSKEFLEELIIRRELADNFCHYNKDYDNFNGFPGWAKRTLDEHRKDKRDYIYSQKEFGKARTHDGLWNAAQTQMLKGKMHGYMRMYWAKKILEWSATPEDAIKIAIYLNDKYELDGKDPNGYTGVAWSIGGVHDRAWGERKVFGKVRYMSYNGARSKFDVDKYVMDNLD